MLQDEPDFKNYAQPGYRGFPNENTMATLMIVGSGHQTLPLKGLKNWISPKAVAERSMSLYSVSLMNPSIAWVILTGRT